MTQQQQHHGKRQEDHKKKKLINPSEEGSLENSRQGLLLDDTLENLGIDRLLCSLSMVIDERLVASVGHIFQVNCTGFGEFYLDLKNGVGNCCKGTSATAEVTFSLNRELLFAIIRKKVTPMQAYLDGSLQVRGSILVAIKLTLLSDRLSCLL